MNDDLEQTLRDSLDRHAASTAHTYGNLNDVVQRVELKHRRRRSLAVIGCIAALAGGVIGFAAFAAGSSDRSVDLAAAAASDGPTTTISANTNVYACANYLGSQDDPAYGQRQIYGDCVVVTWDTGTATGTAVTAAGCVVATTFPQTTVLTTTISPILTTSIPMTAVATSLANATASATGCGDPAAGLPSECFPVMTTTTPTTTSTTSVPAAAIGTAPGNVTGQAVACETYEPGITTVPMPTTSTTTSAAP
jgi:hypothetical protein